TSLLNRRLITETLWKSSLHGPYIDGLGCLYLVETTSLKMAGGRVKAMT
ncbi:9712_t:CDS:1, partial [Paraglomus occultum]